MAFAKAVRSQVHLKVAITGPSGSGKTWGALSLAKGLANGGRIAVIDTENKSASLYGDRFDFDACNIEPPYTTTKYDAALKDAIAGKYAVVVIDSITHEWAGQGGLLEQKEAKDSRGGNSFTNWAAITKEHEAFKAKLLQSPIHVIATIRSKTEYVLEVNAKGKQEPKKVGMAPVQRDGIEYEFAVVFDLSIDHGCVASKDRTSLFDGMTGKLSEEVGGQLRKWLASGAAPVTSPPEPLEPPAAPAHQPEPQPPTDADFIVQPPQPEERKAVTVTVEIAMGWINQAKTSPELGEVGGLISKLPPDVKNALRSAFGAKSVALQKARV